MSALGQSLPKCPKSILSALGGLADISYSWHS